MEESWDDEIYRPPPIGEVPWLITTHENGKANKLEKQLFLMNNKSYTRTIPELHRNVIESAHQGWLILRTREIGSYYSLWNPVTSKLIRLPELLAPELEDDYIEPSACVLTCSPDDINNAETCVLVLFFEEGLVFSCRPTVNRDCSRWVKQRIEVEGKVLKVRRAVVIEGVIYVYAYIREHTSGEFDGWLDTFLRVTFATNSSDSITAETMALESPGFLREPIYARRSYMVESCGAWYFIRLCTKPDLNDLHTIDMDIVKVFVWRLDFSKMEWVQVNSFRNRAFLLGPRCSTWCWAGAGAGAGAVVGNGFHIEENSIYLIDGLKMRTYSLQDDSYSSLLLREWPHSNFLNSIDGPTWFVPPNHQRLSREWEEDCVSNEKTKRPENTNEELQGTQIHKACPLTQWRANRSCPTFMVLKDDSDGTYELIDPYEKTSRTISDVHHFPGLLSTIEVCKDGWLLVRHHGDRLKYLNPFTRMTYEYPICEFIVDSASMGFSTCPTSSDCLTVGLFVLGLKVPIIFCFDASTKEWQSYEVEYNPDKDIAIKPNCKTCSTYHKNAFYFLGMEGNLGVFQIIQGEVRSWHVYKRPFSEEIELNSCYLVELNGELISVFIGETGKWVRVFKFDTSNKCWLELFTLEDHVLFLSYASCFSVLAENREMKDRIYLPKRMGNDIVFYSLDTRKYHTSTGGDPFENFYGMKENLNCCWI